jgi:RimJ/RimL family protein N-acetyltransferase
MVDDLERWTEMMADPETARFIGGVVAKPLVWRSIMQIHGAWALTGVSMFSVIDKARGVWIGRVGPWQPLGWPGTEVGWGLHPDSWGKGLALEAAVASMDYAFDALGWSSVIHLVNRDNIRSQALARRLGSRVQGQVQMPAPFDYETVDVWGQTRDEWRANRQARGSRLPVDAGGAKSR